MSTTTTLRTPTAPPPQHWASTLYGYDEAERLPAHMRPGGTVRTALLLRLAQHPEGVSQQDLGLIAKGACSKTQAAPSADQMRVICGHLAAEGLLAVEEHLDGSVVFYSPQARKAARTRRLNGYTLPARIQPAQVTA